MTQPIQLTDQIYAVEVPEGAKYHRLDCALNGEFNELIFYKDGNDIDFPDEIEEVKNIDLPDGRWQLICTSKEASVAHAANIVEEVEDGYKGYNTREDNVLFWREPIDSLNSLLASKNLDINKNYVLIKKVS